MIKYIYFNVFAVFKFAYAHLVQPWYTVPELGDSQPLHRALQKEFNQVVERVICKAKNFNLSATSVGCIRIFTQHLHNAKQSDGWASLSVLCTLHCTILRILCYNLTWVTSLHFFYNFSSCSVLCLVHFRDHQNSNWVLWFLCSCFKIKEFLPKPMDFPS